MILSFELTLSEYRSGRKTQTRRDWKPRTLLMWQRAWDEGRLHHDAVDKGLHRGGMIIGKFRLTERPYLQMLLYMDAAALKAEGGMVDTVEDFAKLVGKKDTDFMAVVTFKKL